MNWRPIPNFPMDAISSRGDVKSLRTGKIRPTYEEDDGYRRITLTYNGVRKTLRIHRLVLEVFGGPAPDGRPLALHGPKGKRDNSIGNLYWGNHSQNALDRTRDGTQRRSGGGKGDAATSSSRSRTLVDVGVASR